MCVLSTTYVAGQHAGAILGSDLEHSAGFVNAYEQSECEREPAGPRRDESAAALRNPAEHHRRTASRAPALPPTRRHPGYASRAVGHAVRLMYRSLAPIVLGALRIPSRAAAGRATPCAAAAWLCTQGFRAGDTTHVCGATDTRDPPSSSTIQWRRFDDSSHGREGEQSSRRRSSRSRHVRVVPPMGRRSRRCRDRKATAVISAEYTYRSVSTRATCNRVLAGSGGPPVRRCARRVLETVPYSSRRNDHQHLQAVIAARSSATTCSARPGSRRRGQRIFSAKAASTRSRFSGSSRSSSTAGRGDLPSPTS